MDSARSSGSHFFIIKSDGVTKSMLQYAKMVILLAFEEYPLSENDFDKCRLITEKFKEKYGSHWCVSMIKNGDVCFNYYQHYLKIKYKNYTIKIGQTQQN